jgi:hypothetical protein
MAGYRTPATAPLHDAELAAELGRLLALARDRERAAANAATERKHGSAPFDGDWLERSIEVSPAEPPVARAPAIECSCVSYAWVPSFVAVDGHHPMCASVRGRRR